MHLNDLQSEWAFYGKRLDMVGHLYLQAKEQPSLYPDLLFFCIYTCRLLVEKKFTLAAAVELQGHLSLGHSLEKSLTWEEDRPFTLPARTVEYRSFTKSAISSTLMFRDKLHFRFGFMGFGFFSNGKHFNSCAAASVFALMGTLYQKLSGGGSELPLLWDCAERLSHVNLSADLRKGNFLEIAGGIYLDVTGDAFPALRAKSEGSVR